MGAVRATFILAVFAVSVPLLMLPQSLLLLVRSYLSYWLPVRFHRFVCRLIGMRIRYVGELTKERPLLITANHCSWLDIPILSTIGPVSFIAKSEVRKWPLVGWLARLQRTIFVDRTRRSATRQVNDAIAERLRKGDPMILFAEGTSSDGNRVLPFKSALVGAAQMVLQHESTDHEAVWVQPVSVAYTRLNGMPMGRQHRHIAAWYGDITMVPHLWRILVTGPLDVVVTAGEPFKLEGADDRKAVTGRAERDVRRMLAASLAGRPEEAA